jgi:glyoxylase-like metal-dependent hydrolase (beta-lactamase superfamily II)
MNPHIEAFFDEQTNTISYVVREQNGSHCVVLDPVLDYDPDGARISHRSADRVVAYIHEIDLTVDWILETHVHADHLTSAQYLKSKVGGRIAIGKRIIDVQSIFKNIFNEGHQFHANGSQFDHLFDDGEEFEIGALTGRVMHTPGHTPACVTFIIGDAAFIGDTLFMPDYGTARTDFPGGDPVALFQSIEKILSLPEKTRLFLCHDYLTSERDTHQWETTVEIERTSNIHVGGEVGENDFVALRKTRDKESSVPKLLFPSVQFNMRAGKLPPPEENGISYFKIPVDS